MLEQFLNKITLGDCRQVLKNLPGKSVNCIVTSPPYFGLRDYGTAVWIGGDENCDHAGKPFRTKENVNKNTGTGDDVKNKEDREFYKSKCAKCGAVRQDAQVGMEETPDDFVATLVDVFNECQRVLRDDGTLWLNLGDSYNSAASNQNSRKEFGSTINNAGYYTNGDVEVGRRKVLKTLKEKDLIGIPWMVAFALRAAGWYLRQDIIWHKPNPMPESVTDRCTKSHEYIFLFSKSKKYYFDADAIKEPSKNPKDDIRRILQQNENNKSTPDALRAGLRVRHKNLQEKGQTINTLQVKRVDGEEHISLDGKANKRSVWTVTTKPYSEAHFATFPPELIVDCIKAGCPQGGVVLDPFSGAGTTAMVARKLNRNFIAIELNQKYIDIAEKRLRDELGLFR